MKNGRIIIVLVFIVLLALPLITAGIMPYGGSSLDGLEKNYEDTASGVGAFHYVVKIANGSQGAVAIPDTVRTPSSGNYLVVTDISFSWLQLDQADTLYVGAFNGAALTDSVWYWAQNANAEQWGYDLSPTQRIILSQDSALVVSCRSTALSVSQLPDTIFMNIYGSERLAN